MNIRETFLNLTKFTIPHGKEDTLRQYLPNGVKRDEFGNYMITVGNSETLFTSHLDTCCHEMEKVNHVIEGNIIKTDGTTILGGDNKTGVVILLNMIEHNIPGCYYFFAGEEPTAKDGGLYGSKHALAANPEFFKKFKRAVCFDRKHHGSIVTRQMARFTCSEAFVESLIEEFKRQGLEYHPDQTGWYTDTAVFLNVIPEVTNLSSGTWYEHSDNEYVDMNYLEKVAEAACHINWENLPTVRVAKRESSKEETTVHTFKKFANLNSDKKIFYKICGYMDMFNFLCLNDDEFEPGLNMIFSRWHEEVRILIKVENGVIFLNNERVGDLKAFEKMLNIGFEQKVDLNSFVEEIEDISDQIESDNIPEKALIRVLDKHGVTMQDLIAYFQEKDCQLKDWATINPKTGKFTLR
jgi:hypothetical protein